MRRLTVALVVLAALALVPSAAWAQGYFVPSVGYDFGGDAGSCPSLLNDCAQKKASYGIAAGSLFKGVIGFEEEFTYAPDFFGTGGSFGSNSVLTLMSNLVVSVPVGPVRPYVSGGLGWMNSHLDFTLSGSSSSTSNNGLGYDLGGGVMVLLPHHLGVRGDLRHEHSLSDINIAGIGLANAKLNFTRISIGLVLH